MTNRRVVPVVCAVIENDRGEVLLARRPIHKHLGGKWEFAGGKVEAGEKPADALRREIREELGCELEVRRALPEFDYDYGDVVVHMIPFAGVLSANSPAPTPTEHTALEWVGENRIRAMELAPADWPVVESYFGGR